jgi:hypothetical protein
MEFRMSEPLNFLTSKRTISEDTGSVDNRSVVSTRWRDKKCREEESMSVLLVNREDSDLVSFTITDEEDEVEISVIRADIPGCCFSHYRNHVCNSSCPFSVYPYNRFRVSVRKQSKLVLPHTVSSLHVEGTINSKDIIYPFLMYYVSGDVFLWAQRPEWIDAPKVFSLKLESSCLSLLCNLNFLKYITTGTQRGMNFRQYQIVHMWNSLCHKLLLSLGDIYDESKIEEPYSYDFLSLLGTLNSGLAGNEYPLDGYPEGKEADYIRRNVNPNLFDASKEKVCNVPKNSYRILVPDSKNEGEFKLWKVQFKE